MTEAKHCSRCGSRLPDASPIGEACPKCLLAGGLESAGPHELPPTSAASDRWEAPSAEEMDERFVNLEVLEMIGQGGMGAVYRARQSMLGREVAVKVLSPRISNDPAFEKRFAREARALAQLSHPGIVTIYDFGRQDDLCYLVMEFIDGVDLRDAIRAKAIDADKTLEVVSQICDALQYAHAQGVVHRDIKPENILLDRKGRVKLADFGLAKLVGTNDNDASLTATNQVMGTLHYMAPEQLEQPLAVDHRADIYSLGVVFYELLTGQLPLGRFKLPSENDANAAVLDDVVLKTLQRSPDDRYQQVSEVSTDLDRASHANASTDQKDAPSERQLPVESELSRPSIKVISRRADPGLILTGVVIALVGTGLLVHGVSEQRETLWIGVGVAVSAVFLFASAFRSSTAKRVELLSAPNVGVLCHGFSFLWVGAIVIPGGFDTPFGWIGMGLLLGGGYMLTAAWRPPRSGRRIAVWRSPELGQLIPAIGFTAIGMGLLITGIAMREDTLIWVGLGCALAGGGMSNGCWTIRDPRSH